MGYHKAVIEKGLLGDLSKIQEELDELQDAEVQGARILMLCEVADLMGAVEAYLEKNLPGFTLQDCKVMADLTKSAFKDGSRA